MAFTAEEKERRITAAEKRLETYQSRADRFAAKHAEAMEDAQREIEALDWLHGMPTEDDEVEAEQLELEVDA